MKTNIHFLSYLAHFFLQWEMLQKKNCRENQNTFLCSITFFFWKSCRLWDNVEKSGRARQAKDGDTAHEHCMLDTWRYWHGLRKWNTYCSSSAKKKVRRRRLMLSLHVHCLVFFILHCVRRCYCQMRTAERNKAPRQMLRKALPLLAEYSRGAISRRLFCSARTFFSIKLMLSPHPTFFSCLEQRGLAFNERYRPFHYQTRTRI
jgi:hypothetical protein